MISRTWRLPARALLAALAGIVVGCASTPVAWYDGPLHPREQDAVLSPVGGDLQRHFTVVIVGLDGRALEAASVTEVRLAPGTHALRARVKVGTYPEGRRLYWREAEVHLTFEALPGHTYLPDAAMVGEVAIGRVTDLGVGYPAECLPAARRGPRLLPGTPEADAACQPAR